MSNEVEQSFEIKEDFEELKAKLSRSMQDGLINNLAERNEEFPDITKSANSIDNFKTEDYWHNEDRGYYSSGQSINIEKDKIVLEYYENYSLGVDSYGNDDPDYSSVVVIEPNEKGGCVVSGNMWLLQGLSKKLEQNNIFAGARSEMTYVEGSYCVVTDKGNKIKKDDAWLLEDEKHKTNGLQGFKNKFNNYDNKVEINIDDVLKSLEPNVSAVAGSLSSAVYDSDAANLAGPRRDVYINHHIYNHGSDREEEYLDVQDGRYPENSYRGTLDHNDTRSDWGNETTIPEHWTWGDAESYFNMRFEGHPVSEKVFDGYIKSDKENFTAYLKSVVKPFLKNKQAGMSREESLDAALTTLNAKNRVRRSLKQNKEMTADIKEGMAKTKESGYKHIARNTKGGRDE